MPFRDDVLGQPRPASLASFALPRRERFFPSPADWRDEVLYFLLPDRFSDAGEAGRPLLDRANLAAARPPSFRFDRWAQGGGERWQGGTLRGITSKLDYLKMLGVTCLWVGPVFKQRRHLDAYHGYAIQDFLEIDPHFGTRQDLVEMVDAAHAQGLRVILDIIFNHSGHNWDYVAGENPPYKPWPQFYDKGPWIDAAGGHTTTIAGADDDVFPIELRPDAYYTRAGKGSLGAGDVDDPHAEAKRTDFDGSFRDFNYDDPNALRDVARCFKYWIALTDCDGFRLDTLKHVSQEQGRNFCGSIREFAQHLGKADFFLVGEVAGSDDDAQRYGRQYLRQISNFGAPFAFPPAGELIAWSRLLDDEEALCLVNGHGTAARGGQVVVDADLNRDATAFFEVVANSAQAAAPASPGPHPVGQRLPVQFRGPIAFVQIQPLAPSEVLVLVNRA